MKKRILFLLCCLLSISMIAFVGCDNSSQKEPAKPTIVDFNDMTVTTELGDTYSLINFATDTEGNDYQITYDIVTTDGESVVAQSDGIVVDSLGGYIATASVTLADGSKLTRKITINVKDTTQPTVSLSKSRKNGYLGKEYTLPTATVTDNSGDITPELKLYIVDGDNESEVAFADGKFTPSTVGKYKYVVTAKDASNNTTSATREITVLAEKVQETVDATEVVDFDEDDDLENFVLIKTTEIEGEWFEEFEGETGVIKFTTNTDFSNNYYLRPEQAKSAYEGYDYIVFRMYFASGDNTFKYLAIGGTTIQDYVEYDTWVDYRFSASLVLRQWVDEGEAGRIDFWAEAGNNGKYASLYISNIYVENIPKVVISEPAVGYVDQEYTIPTVTVSGFPGEYTLETKLYSISNSVETEVTVTDGKFTPTSAGAYIIRANATDVSGRKSSSYFRFSVLTEAETIDATEVVDFDESDDTVNLLLNDTTKCEWLDEFQGETGVLKITTNTDWGNNLYVYPEQAQSVYQAYDYIVFRMYFADGGNKYQYFKDPGNNSPVETVEYDKWVDYTYPIAKFIESYGNTGKVCYWGEASNNGQYSVVYISKIFVATKPKVVISEPVVGFVDQEYTLPTITVGGFYGDYNLVTKVYSINNSVETEVTLTEGKFTPTSAGAYIIRANVSDASGKNVSSYFRFSVLTEEETIDADEVVDFDESDDTANLLLNDTTKCEWLDEFQGETGVLKITTNTDWSNNLYVYPEQAQSVYKAYDYIVFRMYFADGGNKYQYFKDPGNNSPVETVEYDKWVDYTYPIAKFIESYGNTGKVCYWGEASNNGQYSVVYISKIYVKVDETQDQETAENIDANEVIDFDEEDDAKRLLLNNNKATPSEWLASFEGETGVVKITTNTDWGNNLYIYPEQAQSIYQSYDYIVLRMYFVSGTNQYKYFDDFGGNKGGTVEYDKWKDYVYPTTSFLTNYGNNGYGCFYGEASNNGEYSVVYISNIYVTENIDADEVVDFDHVHDTANLLLNDTTKGEWLASFEGEIGVLKITTNTDWGNNLYIYPEQAQSVYKDYDYIVFRMYFADGANKYKYFKDPGNNSPAETVEYDKWVDYTYPIAKFIESYGNTGKVSYWGEASNNGEYSVLYISKIYVTTIPKVVISEPAVGYVGQEYTLPTVKASGFYGDYDFEVKLYSINGSTETEVTVTEGKFTPTDAGAYIIRASASDARENSASSYFRFSVLTVAETIDATEVVDFDESDDLANLLLNNTTKGEWLDVFEGETGVVKFTTNTDWGNNLYLYPEQAQSVYQSYDTLVIRMYFVSGTNQYKYFDDFGGNKGGTIEYDKWKDYEYPIDSFLTNYGNKGYAWFYGEASNNGEYSVVYISNIYVKNSK